MSDNNPSAGVLWHRENQRRRASGLPPLPRPTPSQFSVANTEAAKRAAEARTANFHAIWNELHRRPLLYVWDAARQNILDDFTAYSNGIADAAGIPRPSAEYCASGMPTLPRDAAVELAFIASIEARLGSCGCTATWRKLLEENPPDLSTAQNYARWTHSIHLLVSKSIPNHPYAAFRLADAVEKWGWPKSWGHCSRE